MERACSRPATLCLVSLWSRPTVLHRGAVRDDDADTFNSYDCPAVAAQTGKAGASQRTFAPDPQTARLRLDDPLRVTGSPAKMVGPWVERLARIGYAAKALLYITVGLLAAQAGLGRGGRPVDTQGALRVVHHATFGRWALLLIAAGLIGYAVWRVVEGVVDPDNRGTDAKGVALRTSFAARGVAH